MSFQEKRDRLEIFYRKVTKQRKKLFLLSDMPKRTFERCFGNLKSGGSLSRKERSDRPRNFSGSDRRRLAGRALKNNNFSSQQIAHRFRAEIGSLMSKHSAYRNLLQSRVGKISPIFTISIKNRADAHFLQWPPHSPDLNPLRNVRQILKDFVEKKNPKNVEELRACIQESQLAFTQEIQVRLMESISRRLEGCLPTGNKLWTTNSFQLITD